MFTVSRRGDSRGFHMIFANGYTVSVQWGSIHYCDNKDKESHEPTESCVNAEVAVWRPDGSFVPLQNADDVLGWLSADKVAQIIHLAANDPESLACANSLIDAAQNGSAGWYRTSKKWSRTTSKHINAWVPRDAMAIDQHILDSLGG